MSGSLLQDAAMLVSGTARISPGRIAEVKLAGDRKEAAQWAARLLRDVQLPTDSDQAFRAALKDGTVLSRLMNEVVPGAVKVGPFAACILHVSATCRAKGSLPSVETAACTTQCNLAG
jgi:hypothetical protein